MTDTLAVAVPGTGIMGAAMARSLVRAGHTVRVWNRTRDKAEPLASDGAEVAGSPAEAVREADAVLTMLYDGGTVLEVMREAAPGLRRGAVWAQSTTVGLESVGELAALADEHGLVLYDAPVLGTRQPAEAGQLTVLAAGPVAGRRAVTPVFEAVGTRTVWTGEDAAAGTATRLKLVTNSWIVAVTAAAGETLALAKGLGVDPPDFAVTTAEKDARLITRAGELHGVRLDVMAASAERFARAAAQGHGEKDMAAAYFASFTDRGPAGADGGRAKP